MKSPSLVALALVAVVVLSSPTAVAGNGGPIAKPAPPAPCSGLSTYLATLPVEPLGDAEKAGLLFTWQEEKLARDVYVAMAARWGNRVFTNIASSEQEHMDSTAFLLGRYGLAAAAANEAPGLFQDSRLAALYVSLVEKGSASLVDALVVGATIEDLDLADVGHLLASADNADVRTLAQNLLKGSRNHLRSFASLLDGMGVVYAAQYISAAELAEIVSTEAEVRVVYDADGNAVAGIAAGPCTGKGNR